MNNPSVTYIVVTASLSVLLWTSAAKSETAPTHATQSGGTQGLQEQLYEERMKDLQAALPAQGNQKSQMNEGGAGGSEASGTSTPGTGAGLGSSKTGETEGVRHQQGDAQPTSPRK